MRQLILVGLLAFAVALTGTAYAEVQNIKVSGDLDMKAVTHHNYDLKIKQNNGNLNGTSGVISNDDDADFLLSTLHVNVDADLTDNVSTSVRLLNQRKWGAFSSAPDQISIDNAYVTLKEFFYSPLTIVAGRQNLVYGSGFIVGNGLLQDPNGVFTVPAVNGSQMGQEYSAFNAFDAVRAILDFSPVTVETVFARVADGKVANAGKNLYGLYVTYKADRWNATVEPYYFYKDDESGTTPITVNDATSGGAVRTYGVDRVSTVGLRVTGSPIENLKLEAEGAHQFGLMVDTATSGETWIQRHKSALGANVYANYTWAKVPWTPSTGAGWVYYSGNAPRGNRTSSDGIDRNSTFTAWDPMFRGSFTTYIQDFLSGADAPANLYTTFDANDTAATTNRHLIYGDVGVSPMKDVKLWARYTNVRFARAPRPGRSTTAGNEVDAKATYDYTDDVQFSLFGGLFKPGRYYEEVDSNLRGRDLAWTVGTGTTVKF